MSVKNLKKDLTTLFTKNNYGELIKQLSEIFDPIKSKNCLEVVTMKSAVLEDLKYKKRMGVMDSKDYELELAKLRAVLLGLIEDISEEEAKAYHLRNAIFKKILVVCKQQERIEVMQTLFSERYYKAVEYTHQFLATAEIANFDLVVFDNYPKDIFSSIPPLLIDYLEQTTAYILYYGSTLSDLHSYSDRVYYANSKFSLHSRLQEMLLYLKHEESKNTIILSSTNENINIQ